MQVNNVRKAAGDKQTILSICVAKLFFATAKEQKWTYSGHCGGVCLIIDRSLNGAVILRLYDLNFFDKLFEFELFFEFYQYYKQINTQFFAFPIHNEFIAGISFADEKEAILFKMLVQSYGPTKDRCSALQYDTNLASQMQIKDLEAALIQRLNPAKLQMNKLIAQQIKEQERIERNLSQKRKKKSQTFDNDFTISKPTSVVHMTHIGWDNANQCADFSHLEKEFKALFKKAGIKKKDLKDKDTERFIYDALINQRSDLNNLKFKRAGNKQVQKKKTIKIGEDIKNEDVNVVKLVLSEDPQQRNIIQDPQKQLSNPIEQSEQMPINDIRRTTFVSQLLNEENNKSNFIIDPLRQSLAQVQSGLRDTYTSNAKKNVLGDEAGIEQLIKSGQNTDRNNRSSTEHQVSNHDINIGSVLEPPILNLNFNYSQKQTSNAVQNQGSILEPPSALLKSHLGKAFSLSSNLTIGQKPQQQSVQSNLLNAPIEDSETLLSQIENSRYKQLLRPAQQVKKQGEDNEGIVKGSQVAQLSNQQKINITSALANAINIRRQNMMINEDPSDDDEQSDGWSSDDK